MVIPILAFGYFVYHSSLDVTGVILTFILSVVAGTVLLAMGQALVGLIKSSDTVNSTARLLSMPLIFGGALGELGWFGDVIKTIVDWSPFGVARSLLQFAVAPSVATPNLWLI